jgi:hypothetical protein
MRRSIAAPFAAIVAAAFLSACASTPTYTPAATERASGYSETQIENNRYFVTYRARNGADAQLIEDYAMLRASEITLERGRDWFYVDRRNVDVSESRNSGPSIGIGVGGGNYGRSSGVSGGVGFSFPLGGQGAAQATNAQLEIRLGEGAKPNEPNAYDAHSLSSALRARLQAPQ